MFLLRNVNFKNIVKFDSLEIPRAQTTFICGESGTGKSTLLKLLNGVLSPSEGEIFYLGEPLENYEPIFLRREILLVSQSVFLFDSTIRENFCEFYSYKNLLVPSDEEIKNFLEICALSLPLESNCQFLSGGERQRVFTAINLSFAPKVLLLDEPTSALDEKNAHALIKNIKSHCEKNEITLTVVSHDRTIAEKFADNVILLG
ncbi:MAG: ABC transporter ATP-binding protein [Defluviitaleaceae bacterium]|nr:ABC transporter ATP-binding protein [Defluviitaleaceae bacterium]